MNESPARHASWQELLGSPQRSAHIVQIYDSDDFLASGVALFAAEGLRRGEAVLLTGTAAHLASVRRALALRGVDARAAARDGRLSTFDVHQAIAAVVVDGVADAARFGARAGDALANAVSDARFSGVRWWGELSHVLRQHGNEAAALACEDLANAAIDAYGVTIFCSYQGDKFDPAGYEGFLPRVCAAHSHVIPAEDYVRHRLAVNRAIADVVGEIRGPLLQSLVSWKGLPCDLPSSQAMLFWLRDEMPERFHEVLTRARDYG
jgi:hypothetical protein